MPEIVHDGARIHYEVTGSGPAILLGHSLLCDTEMWRGVAPKLAERHRVVNVEARGHRRSTAPGPFALEDLAGDWLAIMDRERIDRAFLVGLSMGGMTAMRLALRAPSRVAGLVLIDSNADAEERGKRAQYTVMEAIYRRWGMLRPLARRTASIMFGKTTLQDRRHLIDELVETVERHPREQVALAIHAVFSRKDLRPRLAEIAAPALVLVGAEDKATPPAKSAHIRDGIPGARIEVLDGAGHLSALEVPDAVSARVLAFLGDHRW
jgi:pimeloyl-ACP methyl ester carboxylesterase